MKLVDRRSVGGEVRPADAGVDREARSRHDDRDDLRCSLGHKSAYNLR